jgi:hypothetical protein
VGAILRGGEVVDEDASAFGEGEESVFVNGHVDVWGAVGELILYHPAHDSLGQFLRLRHHFLHLSLSLSPFVLLSLCFVRVTD